MKSPPRGEVWLVDLGLAAKVRPCLVLSVPAGDADRALVSLVPHTTSVRGSRFEVVVAARFLRPGAFDAQGLVTVPHARLVRPIGSGHLQPYNFSRSRMSYALGSASATVTDPERWRNCRRAASTLHRDGRGHASLDKTRRAPSRAPAHSNIASAGTAPAPNGARSRS